MPGMTDLTPMESIAFELIDEIQTRHREESAAPDYATMREVTDMMEDEMRSALRNLYRRGLIEYHATVNGMPMFSLTTNEDK